MPHSSSEEAVRQKARNDVLNVALASAGIGAFSLDGEQLFSWDEHCKSLLGVTADRSAPSDFFPLIHPLDRERLRQSIASVGGEFCAEVRLAPPSVRVLELRGKSIGAPLVAGTMRDVTEERAREQREAELARTELFSELLVGVAAHELRQPLAGIIMAARLASKHASAETLPSMLDRIVTMAERSTRMVDQLLDFTCARGGAGIPLKPAPADLAIVAEEVVAELRLAHPEWRVALESEGTTIGSFDPDRLAQVLFNLVGNAIDHGEVEHGVRVHIDGSQAEELVVEVQNQGLLSAEVSSTLFRPFHDARQKRDRSRGFGLGLYLTQQIAHAHAGEVEVVSQEPEGTVVRVRLPRGTQVPRPSEVTVEEMLALERFAAVPPSTAVTAQLFGAAPLRDRAPQAYREILQRYDALLAASMERRIYKEREGENLDASSELRALADRLGAFHAGAREVAELHTRAIRQRTEGTSPGRAQAVIAEGRIMAFELMGHLLSFYRRRAVFSGPELAKR